MRIILAAIAIAVVAAAGFGMLAAGRAADREVPVARPCVAWTGPETKVSGRKFERVRDQAAWESYG
jgi:hypothetical protein